MYTRWLSSFNNYVDLKKYCKLCIGVWLSVATGVTPADLTIAPGIEEDRRCQFEELKSTLEVMRLIDNNSSSSDIVSIFFSQKMNNRCMLCDCKAVAVTNNEH